MPLTRLDHVLVLTDDIDGTRDFYRDALGLDGGDRPPLEFPGYWLYAAGVPCVHVADRAAYTAHSATTGIPASPPAEGTGALDHLAFSGDDHDEAVARLERTGVDAEAKHRARHRHAPAVLRGPERGQDRDQRDAR